MYCSRKAYAVAFLLLLLSCSLQPLYPEPPLKGHDVSIDISTLQAGLPRFFSYRFQGRSINFFVVKIEDRVLSFLDACTKCHPKKLGFRFDRGSVFCKACDEGYPVAEIERGIGSCYPIRVEGRTEGGTYHISAADLEEQGGRFFP